MDFKMAVVCEILKGWHVNSHVPADEAFIPTELAVSPSEHVEITAVRYPGGVLREFSFSEEPLSVYEKKFAVIVDASVVKTVAPSEVDVVMTLRYQACDDRMCLEPVEKAFSVSLKVVGTGTPVMKNELGVFVEEADPVPVSGRFGNRGLILSFLLVFVGGLALNLTPCIYPMIPITISYFGGQSEGSQKRLFMLAIMYVVGIAITYSVLGLFAALTGSLLGSAMQNPIVLAFVALVLVGLALSMFDVYALRMPGALTRVGASSKGGALGSLFMGLTLGVVIAPCVGPFVLGLLTYVGRLGNPLLGFWMFFTLALGMGVPLVILGVLSGSISRLPRSGDWMVWVKKVFGFVLLAMAVYFLRTLLPLTVYWLALAAIALCGGLYLGWLEKVAGMGRWFRVFRKVLGAASILLVAWLVVTPGHIFPGRRSSSLIDWRVFKETSFREAAENGLPALVDFAAEWCVPCHELDEKTFSDPRVAEKAREFAAFRVDLTAGPAEDVKSFMQRHEVAGVPTLMFFDAEGEELTELKCVGFIGPDSLLTLLESALSANKRKEGGE
jgi:thiol:disulfide interchange protein DsbD